MVLSEQKFITNLGNSQAAISEEILSEERLHWSLGLRKAELVIFERQKALFGAQISSRKQNRKVKWWRSLILLLERTQIFWRYIPILNLLLTDRHFDLLDAIEEYQFHQSAIAANIRDCMMELTTAIAAKQRILGSHPEVLEWSYLQLQEYTAKIALTQKKARYIASRIWATAHHLPIEVGSTFLESSPTECAELWAAAQTHLTAIEQSFNQSEDVRLKPEVKELHD